MSREIGSEFWKIDIGGNKQLLIDSPHQYLLSGRTALDFIIKDIKASKDINSVYMPSYCCHTMIQPFLDNDIDIEFYNVSVDNGRYTYDINFETQCDVILIMKYFGFENEVVDKYIQKFKNIGKVIIEDATHSWLSDSPYNKNSHYVLSSLRKWTGIPGGAIALKNSGNFIIQAPSKQNLKYIELRNKAAVFKKQFIEDGIGQKEAFLEMFKEAEEILESDYSEYGIPTHVKNAIKLLDISKLKEARKENSKILIEGLKHVEGVESIILTDKDVPLFIPILVLDGKRDKLRQYLIDNKIYSPVHWPLTTVHKIKNKNLYDNCLSLVCDQRYEKKDMKRIIDLINDFYRKEVKRELLTSNYNERN